MRARFGWAVAFALLSAMGPSCKSRFQESGVLPPDSMRVILWQLMEADAAINGMNFRDHSMGDRNRAYAELYLRVFNAHHLTREAFMHSYHYYMDDPTLLKTVIDSMSSLQRRKVQYPAFTHGPPAKPTVRPGVPAVVRPGVPAPGQNIGHPTAPLTRPPTFSPPAQRPNRRPATDRRPAAEKDTTTRHL